MEKLNKDNIISKNEKITTKLIEEIKILKNKYNTNIIDIENCKKVYNVIDMYIEYSIYLSTLDETGK